MHHSKGSVFQRLEFPIQSVTIEQSKGNAAVGIQRQNIFKGNGRHSKDLDANANRIGPFCVRCVMFGHLRPACQNKIHRRAYNGWAHIEKDCWNSSNKPNPNLTAKSVAGCENMRLTEKLLVNQIWTPKTTIGRSSPSKGV